MKKSIVNFARESSKVDNKMRTTVIKYKKTMDNKIRITGFKHVATIIKIRSLYGEDVARIYFETKTEYYYRWHPNYNRLVIHIGDNKYIHLYENEVIDKDEFEKAINVIRLAAERLTKIRKDFKNFKSKTKYISI